MSEHWPFDDLILRTPRLELRPDDDAGVRELAALAYEGVHPPERMPFLTPWTDADPRYMGRGTMQFHWSQRAALAPDDWLINFLVRIDGRVVGTQNLSGKDFAVTREVVSGSWLGMTFQGQGIGTEMRAAVLTFAFDHLGALTARSEAFDDNVASHRVSEKLGYRADGTRTVARRGERATVARYLLRAADVVRPVWELSVEGAAECLPVLGAFQSESS